MCVFITGVMCHLYVCFYYRRNVSSVCVFLLQAEVIVPSLVRKPNMRDSGIESIARPSHIVNATSGRAGVVQRYPFP